MPSIPKKWGGWGFRGKEIAERLALWRVKGGQVLCRGVVSPCFLCAMPVETDSTLCADCWASLPRHAEAHQRTLVGVGQVRVGFDYVYPVVSLIRALKFGRALYLAPTLAQVWQELSGPVRLPDCVVPIPLSRQRWRSRGYNQALELARPLAHWLRCPVQEGLFRLRATLPQAELPRAARQSNVVGAFRASARLQGQRVALVDDVLTTGATLEAATEALHQVGVGGVDVWVCAEAPVPDPF
ncbi:phosphoribosyltransferase family protein [Ferrovum sp.]|jgi:ComF family protein|uniref:ComF family protein n=1 Tax=Ferrovum sp. TaxID=2609467 RepID=UPI0026252779|nr:phosphoribosyltransferase family protein [Ferrovum sp.]